MIQESEHKGLSLTMVFCKSPIPTCQIKVHGKPLEQVNSFVYLGSVFTSDGRCEKEVKRRIGIAKTAFTSRNKVLCGRNISMPVRLSTEMLYLVNCYTDIEQRDDEKPGGSRTLISKKNVENTLD